MSKQKPRRAYVGRYFKSYETDLSNFKLQTLDADVFRTWFNLSCLALRSDCGGELPCLAHMALELRMSETNLGAHIQALIAAKFVVKTVAGLAIIPTHEASL